MNAVDELIRLYAKQLKIPSFAEYREVLRQADPSAGFADLLLELMKAEHKQAASKLREILAKYQEVELLLKIGEYQKGADRATDEAIAKIDRVNAFLCQGLKERPAYEETVRGLMEAVS